MKDYLKLLKFTRRYLGYFILGFVLMGFSAIFDGASLSMIVPVSDKVLTNKKIIIPGNAPDFIQQAINHINSLSPMYMLKIVAIVILGIFLFKGVLMFFQNFIMNIISQRVVRDVRNSIYRKFQELPLEFFSKKRAGELISRITNDAGLLGNALSSGLKDLIYQSMQVVIFAGIAFFINYKLAFISLVIFPLIIYPIWKVGKKIRKLSVTTQERMADLNTAISETVSGVKVVKGFCREGYEAERFARINSAYCKYMLKSIKRSLLLSPSTEFIGVLAAVSIFILGGREVIEGRLSFGVFGLFLASLMSMVRPFKRLSQVHSLNQQAIAASQRIYQVLEMQSEIKEKPSAVAISPPKKEIVFEDVYFKYQGASDYILKGVSFKVNIGETVAIVGPSGTGKSTLVNLIPRFYDVSKGRITFDGIDIRDVKLSSLRQLIGIVTQDIILFNDTIKANIAYGCLDASFEEIQRAARQALADGFIRSLPQGYDTVVGDRGFKLSGGEKQRICIARAILKNPAVLILDEATSQLDAESEGIVQKALDNIMAGRTAFVIAHRLSTVINAVKIIVLDKGKIAAIGRHEYLLENSPVYQKLYKSQP